MFVCNVFVGSEQSCAAERTGLILNPNTKLGDSVVVFVQYRGSKWASKCSKEEVSLNTGQACGTALRGCKLAFSLFLSISEFVFMYFHAPPQYKMSFRIDLMYCSRRRKSAYGKHTRKMCVGCLYNWVFVVGSYLRQWSCHFEKLLNKEADLGHSKMNKNMYFKMKLLVTLNSLQPWTNYETQTWKMPCTPYRNMTARLKDLVVILHFYAIALHVFVVISYF